MHYTVTTLVENAVAQSGQALLGEHGLSFYIEAGDRKILKDNSNHRNYYCLRRSQILDINR